jgi:hypothetical protein
MKKRSRMKVNQLKEIMEILSSFQNLKRINLIREEVKDRMKKKKDLLSSLVNSSENFLRKIIK